MYAVDIGLRGNRQCKVRLHFNLFEDRKCCFTIFIFLLVLKRILTKKGEIKCHLQVYLIKTPRLVQMYGDQKLQSVTSLKYWTYYKNF